MNVRKEGDFLFSIISLFVLNNKVCIIRKLVNIIYGMLKNKTECRMQELTKRINCRHLSDNIVQYKKRAFEVML